MQYAILGDIHSSLIDLQEVLKGIVEKAPNAKVVGTGDIFECTVSKKDLHGQKYASVDEVLLNPSGFQQLLTFPTVYGNQEERILVVTENEENLRTLLLSYKEKMTIIGAEIIHGHQWVWGGEPWQLLYNDATAPLTFYGHSHHSQLTLDGNTEEIQFGKVYQVKEQNVLVNVGSVVGNREWVLYDSEQQTVIFMKEKLQSFA